ncbi:MAG: glycosyltransferase family 4 protein [Ignavibacteria bacterium]|nr:glycosyltransferase family 4 protein [Ignavibacteria bacterium]
MSLHRKKILFVANSAWHLQNFRAPLIVELMNHGAEVVAIAPRDQYADDLVQKLGVRYISIPIGRKTLNPISDLVIGSRLHRLYVREAPDIVFHNTIKPVIYGSIAAHHAGVRRIVNMIPGLGYVFSGTGIAQRLLRPLVTEMYRFALRRSHVVLFQNPDDREFFELEGLVTSEKARMVYGSGVDLTHFYFVEPRTGASTRFLFLGRMLWNKGVGEFVSAAVIVRKRHPETEFQLLGIIDKENPSSIPEKTVRQWHDSGDIEFLGSTNDVRSVLKDSDVVVLPSYYREGVPRSLLEAAAMGKAIVTTDMPGCREAVIHQQTGILVPPKSVDALVEAMTFMINEPKRRAEMGRQARQFASQSFDVEDVNRKILGIMNID